MERRAGVRREVAATGVTGVCGSGIIDLIAEMYLAGIIDADGTIVGDNAERTDDVVADGRTFRYVFYRRPHRAVDHAERRACDPARQGGAARRHRPAPRARRQPAVTDIRLAGAFGAHIDPLHAMVLGLVPDCPLDGVRSVGNAAGAGAVMALLSAERARRDGGGGAASTKIETATEPRFQELFVAAMAIPHATAPTDHLGNPSTLPSNAAPVAAASGRRDEGDAGGETRGRRGRPRAARRCGRSTTTPTPSSRGR